MLSDNIMWQWLPLELQVRSGEVVTASEAVHFNNWLKGLADGIDRPFIYIPNPGNVGDSLIVLGTIQLFHRLNIGYQVGSPYVKYEGELLVYGGGGNFVENIGNNGKGYPICANFLRNNHEPRNNNTIVLLPHSVRGYESLLGTLGPNVCLWARERASFDHMSNACTGGAHVNLWHDMALNTVVDIEKVRSNSEKQNATLFAFRTDREAPEGQIPPRGNLDIVATPDTIKLQLQGAPELSSEQMADLTGMAVPDELKINLQSAFSLLRVVGARPKVYTNRLHVGVACAIMQADCELYDNSYGKLSSVFNYSLCPTCKYGERAKHIHLASGLYPMGRYYEVVVSKFHPHFYDRSLGWHGQTYEAALDFCDNIDGYALCPYDAVCPLGTNRSPISLYLNVSGPLEEASWVPVIDEANEWVQIALLNSCIKHSAMNPEPPEWGRSGIGNEEITRNILCCAKAGTTRMRR